MRIYKKYLKRCIDIVFSLLALPFVLLVILIIAPVIYINDPGAIFYIAERRGRYGENFNMIKFRSMYINAPDIINTDGSTFNDENDPRVTKVGRIIRKLSIDEIPQLINVFTGSMSFVGPRPGIPRIPYEEISDVLKHRLEVRPGITGYSQAYYRNSISQDEKIKNDCFYVDNVNFIMDVKILIQTFKTVIKRENIYIADSKLPSEQNSDDKEKAAK
jgi:Sugar transferases involved in lipopolysaccharide synthesis